jgi:hypothetical protein
LLDIEVQSKMKGEVAQVKEKMPKKPAARSMMEVLRGAAESLNLPKTS